MPSLDFTSFETIADVVHRVVFASQGLILNGRSRGLRYNILSSARCGILGVSIILVGLLSIFTLPSLGHASSSKLAPRLTVLDESGVPVEKASVDIWSLNATSRLAIAARSTSVGALMMDSDFSTKDLRIGQTAGNVVFSTFTDKSGIALLNVTSGIFLINAYRIHVGYFNLVSSPHTGWEQTVRLKPESSAEPNGPYEGAVDGSFSTRSFPISGTGVSAGPSITPSAPVQSSVITYGCSYGIPTEGTLCISQVRDDGWFWMTWNVIHSWYFVNQVHEVVTETVSQSISLDLQAGGLSGSYTQFASQSKTWDSANAVGYMADGSYVPVKLYVHIAYDKYYHSWMDQLGFTHQSTWYQYDAIELNPLSFSIFNGDIHYYSASDGAAAGLSNPPPGSVAGPTNTYTSIATASSTTTGFSIGDSFTDSGVTVAATLSWNWQQDKSLALSWGYESQAYLYYVYPDNANGQSGGYSFAFTESAIDSHGNPSADFFVTVSSNPLTICTSYSGCYNYESIEVTAVNKGFSATLSFSASGFPSGTSYQVTPFTSVTIQGDSGYTNLKVDASGSSYTQVGTYTITVSGSASAGTHSATFSLVLSNGPDWSISASSTTVNTTIYSVTTLTITLSSVDGFAGTVDLLSNQGTQSCPFSPASVNLTPTNSPQTSSFSCRFYNPGDYAVGVSGADFGSPGHVHSVYVLYHVTGYSVSANPTSFNLSSGTTGVSTITVAPLNGFVGTITLSASANSVVCSLSSTSLTFTQVSTSPQTSTLSCAWSESVSNPPGTANAWVYGISGPTTLSSSLIFYLQGFIVAANPASITMQQYTCWSSSISVTSVNGFNGTATLQASSSNPSSLSTGFGSCAVPSGQTSVSVSPSSPTTSATLEINSCNAGVRSYSIWVSGTSSNPSLTNGITISVTVTSGSGGCGGSGGSVAAGTLITLASGTNVPVQNLKIGSQLLSYNVTTNQFASATVTKMTTVTTDNMLIIKTLDGRSLRTDNATIQKLTSIPLPPTTTWPMVI